MRSEFDFIQYIKKSFGLRAIGDDCAVLPMDSSSDMVITADLLVEDIDFKLDWIQPEMLGHKALAISLSDIAAMGADPVWAMLSLGIPEKLWRSDFVKRFYEGWSALSREFNVELVGGDISRSPDRFFVDSFVGGRVPKGEAVLRSTAKVGDKIFVTGALGAAAGGLKLLESGLNMESANEGQKRLLIRQLRPTPRIASGRDLRENSVASAMIDLSDGLSSDIHRICEESAVGAELDVSQLPIDNDIRSVFSEDEGLALALNGGEDFELLFTIPQGRPSLLQTSDLTLIGTITKNAGVVELIDEGERIVLQPSGYRHF